MRIENFFWWWFAIIIDISGITKAIYSGENYGVVRPSLKEKKYEKITEYLDPRIEFLNRLNTNFFDNERATNSTSVDALTQYVKAGIAAEFRSYFVVQLEYYRNGKLKGEQASRYTAEKSFPLPNTSHVLVGKNENLPSPATVALYNTNLSGLNYCGASELISLYVLFTSNITICGQHSIKLADESFDGNFCYDARNISSLLYSNPGKNEQLSLIIHEGDYDSINQVNSEYYPAAGTKKDLLHQLHLEAFNRSLLQTYLPIVFDRYQNLFSKYSVDVSSKDAIIRTYTEKAIDVLQNLVHLYWKTIYNVINVTDVNGKTIKFVNVVKFHRIGFGFRALTDNGLFLEYRRTYSFESGDRIIIRYDWARYTLRHINIDLSVKLKQAGIITNPDIFANTENIHVSVSAQVADDDDADTDPEVSTAITLAITESIVNFLRKIYSQIQIN